VQRAILCVVNAKVRNRIDFPKKGVYCVEKITCIKKTRNGCGKEFFRNFAVSWARGAAVVAPALQGLFSFFSKKEKPPLKRKKRFQRFVSVPVKQEAVGSKQGETISVSPSHTPFLFGK
jgi:hypothetical protein